MKTKINNRNQTATASGGTGPEYLSETDFLALAGHSPDAGDAVCPEGLLETLLRNSPDLIYAKDLQSRFVWFSNSFWNHFNLPGPEGLLGKTDFDLFTEEHARPAYEDEQEIIRTGRPIVGKLEKETYADGRVTWALTTKMPWRDNEGKIIGTVGISRNVTALKEAEDKVAYEQALFRTLLDNLPDHIYYKDVQSRFVHASRSKAEDALKHSTRLQALCTEKHGRHDNPPVKVSGELLAGLTDYDLFARENADQAYADEQEILRSGKPMIDKLEKFAHLDGKTSWFLCTKMPWRDAQGNLIGTFGISRDITALKQAELELDEAHRRLLDASRLAGMAEVASDVLHNVGNTLNSINVSCSVAVDHVKQCGAANLAKIPQLLQQNAGRLDHFLTADPQGKLIPEYLAALAHTFEDHQAFLLRELEVLRKHVEHVNQIVAMQQNYARVAGIEEIVDLVQLVEDAVHINAAALDRHTVKVRREFDPVPPTLADKHRILQILVNLIRNAKYALSDSEQPDKLLTLRVRCHGQNQVQIQVLDNGVGIPAENLTRIFNHGFTTRRDGHGFGLHSGSLAARELGGSLTAHSDGPGKGATFTLLLPIKSQPAPP